MGMLKPLALTVGLTVDLQVDVTVGSATIAKTPKAVCVGNPLSTQVHRAAFERPLTLYP